jgi:hypothetical protein
LPSGDTGDDDRHTFVFEWPRNFGFQLMTLVVASVTSICRDTRLLSHSLSGGHSPLMTRWRVEPELRNER